MTFLGMLHDFLMIFLPLLVVIDPAGTLPLFLALTEHYSEENRRLIARRATVVAAIAGISFVIVGQALFTFLNVRFSDFQIAGGVLLVVLSIVDLLSTGKPAVDEEELRKMGDRPPGATIGVVPLAIPLIVGPATMTTSLLLVNTYGKKYGTDLGEPAGTILVVAMVSAALAAVLVIQFLIMRHSALVVRLMGRQTMAVINKIVMILLAAIAVSLIRNGIITTIAETTAELGKK